MDATGGLTPAAAARRAAGLRRLSGTTIGSTRARTPADISHAEYDALVRELRALETRFLALVTPENPTQRVAGAAVGDLAGYVRHRGDPNVPS